MPPPIKNLVPVEGVEPPRLAAQVPKTCVSTSSTIRACKMSYPTNRGWMRVY